MKVLVVDDDRKIATAVKRGLEAEGFTVEVSFDGDDGFWKATENAYDLIVLDIMLPKRNGYRLCADLRDAGNWTPVLMLTAKDGDLDEAEALDTGADDYLTKPFSFPVLVARIRALLRRTGNCVDDSITAGGLRIDSGARRVFRDDHEVPLRRVGECRLHDRGRVCGVDLSGGVEWEPGGGLHVRLQEPAGRVCEVERHVEHRLDRLCGGRA